MTQKKINKYVTVPKDEFMMRDTFGVEPASNTGPDPVAFYFSSTRGIVGNADMYCVDRMPDDPDAYWLSLRDPEVVPVAIVRYDSSRTRLSIELLYATRFREESQMPSVKKEINKSMVATLKE